MNSNHNVLRVIVPAGTPRPILERVGAEIANVARSAAVRNARAKRGATPMTMSVDRFEKHLHADIASWAKVVKLAGGRTDR